MARLNNTFRFTHYTVSTTINARAMNICQFEVACDQISMKMFLLAKRISKAYSHAKWFENSSLTLTKLSHGIWYLNYSVCSLLSMGKCVAGAWKSVTKDLLSNVSEWKEIITSQIEKVLQHKMWCMELDKVERNISIYTQYTLMPLTHEV